MAAEAAAQHFATLKISVDDFGFKPGHLLPPQQLAQAFSNCFTITCAQVLVMLQVLPLPPDPDVDAEVSPAEEGSGAGLGGTDEPDKKVQRRLAMLQRHRRRAAQRERVDVLQILFPHIVDIKHFASVLLVRLSPHHCTTGSPTQRECIPTCSALRAHKY